MIALSLARARSALATSRAHRHDLLASICARAASKLALDAHALDARALDARTLDARALDARALDARALDARALDARALDARALDARALDARALDARAPAIAAAARGAFATRARRGSLAWSIDANARATAPQRQPQGPRALALEHITLGLVALLSTACFDAVIPPGALITCVADAECPNGFVCQEARKLCVPQADLDETPPALDGAPVLSPERGGLGSVFTLSFTANEALAQDPEVLVDIGGGLEAAPRFVVDDAATDRDARTYTFTYEASGAEATGEPSPVVVRLVDASENPSADLSGGVITFDFEIADFVGAPVVTPELAAPGQTVLVTFAATEALASAALSLEPEGGGLAIPMTDVSGDLFAFEYDVDGSEDDGPYTIVAALTDTSGNVAVGLFAGRVVLDVTPPSAQVGASIRRIPDIEPRGDLVLDANLGSLLEVTFVASEPLASSPAVRLSCPNGELAGARVGDITSTIVFLYRFTIDAGLGEGACDVRGDLVDAAGNEAPDVAILSPAVEVDQTEPDAPLVDEEAAIVYRRVPWGADDTGGAKSFTIDGVGGSVESFARVAVYESATDAPDDAIARVDADDTGAFLVALNPVDRADLFLAQIDPAGNEGPRVRVRDVEWVATLGGKVPGSTFINPNRFEARSFFTDNLTQGAAIEFGAEAAFTDGAPVATSGAATWSDATERGTNPAIESPAIAYDAVTGRLVIFGGASCGCGSFGLVPCRDTFERVGPRWRGVDVIDPDGDGQPVAQAGAALVSDVAGGTPLLLGVEGPGDVWRFERDSWRRACKGTCAQSGPTPRAHFAAAHDPARRTTVMFGGRLADGTLSDETWLFDGNAWRQVCADASCNKPPPRAAHAMAYDSDTGHVTIFGGDGAGSLDNVGLRNDIWAFDGTRWTELCTDAACAASKPTARSGLGMAHDVTRGELVIHGGLSEQPSTCPDELPESQILIILDDTVTFDGALFRAVVPADVEGDGNPGARRLQGMAWDPRRERVVLVSGVSEEPCFTLGCVHGAENDTWEWDGASWVRFGNVTQPSVVESPSATWDAQRGEVMLIGAGTAISRFKERWRQSGTFATLHARVSESNNGAIVFGGINGSTPSSFTGLAGAANFSAQFCLFVPCPAPPPARSLHASAESPSRGALVFGGTRDESSTFDGTTIFADTWRFSSSGWVQECIGCVEGTTAPSRRFGSAMALDADRDVTVLFGGRGVSPTPIGETWEYDGATWSQRVPANVPSERADHTMVYDQLRQRVVMFGGFNGGFFGVDCGDGDVVCRDLLEWDGVDWVAPVIADVENDGDPQGRTGHAMAFSETLGKSVMFGGGSAETWLYDGGGGARPAHVISIPFVTAGTALDEEIVDVEARFVAGGTGGAGDGVDLLAWDVDGWRSVSTNAASTNAAATVQWSSLDTPLDDLDISATPRLFIGRERTLFFAVAPTSPNGARAGFGEVTTDAAEVVVRYRLP